MTDPIVIVGGVRSYKLGGSYYASVSACLDTISAKRFLPDEEYLDRGTRLHEWTTTALIGGEPNVPGDYEIEYEQCVVPALNWFKRHHAVIQSVETVSVSSLYRMAGRPDVVCQIVDNWIIDLKFAEAVLERYEFQLHGYRMADRMKGHRMGILQIPRNGVPKLHEVKYDSNKETLIASAANLLRWQIARAALDLTAEPFL